MSAVGDARKRRDPAVEHLEAARAEIAQITGVQVPDLTDGFDEVLLLSARHVHQVLTDAIELLERHQEATQ